MHKIPFVALMMMVAVTAAFAQDMKQRALGDPEFDWKAIENEWARIYFKSGSFAERHREMLLRSVTASIDEDLAFLGEATYGRTLNVFFVDDRPDMERITGRPVTGFAHWGADSIFLVCSPEWRSFEKHEFAHIVTMGEWGPPHETSRWMIEGIAIAADGWCQEYSVDAIALHYLQGGELPALGELPDRLGELGEIRGGVYAASVLAFIRNEYGAEALRGLWENGFDDISSISNLSIKTLEEKWRGYLEKTVDDSIPVDIEAIDNGGCG
jgi:hypothetical protein